MQPNLQQRLERIRNRVLLLGGGTMVALLLLLIFVPIDEKVQARGRIHAERETYVRSPVEAILVDLPVTVGTRVESGVILARLDASEEEGALQTLEARITQAEAELELRRNKLARISRQPLPNEFLHTEEDFEIAQKKMEQSKVELERLEALGQAGAVSRHHLENAQLAAALAEAEFAKAKKKVQIIGHGLESTILDEAKAEIEAAQERLNILLAERKALRAEVERHTIRAPEAGVVTLIRKRTRGEHLEKGETLFHLAHGEERFVKLHATERQYHRIHPGQKVLMTTPSFDRLRYGYIKGSVEQTAMESEPTPGGEEETYRVAVRVDHAPQPLMLGASVEAEIILRRTPLWRLLVPESTAATP